MRRGTRRGVTFARKRPSLTWSDLSTNWSFAGITATTATVLIQLQSPTSLAALTSDPPEDLTVLRLVGEFNVAIANAAANWSLALTVADVTWTPGATVSVDNDKRLLWQRNYVNLNAATADWVPPGMYREGTAQMFPGDPTMTMVDIAPRVRIEPGKALYLVAYENAASAALTVTSFSMRVLYKRSRKS